jgi:hypothetical protein
MVAFISSDTFLIGQMTRAWVKQKVMGPDLIPTVKKNHPQGGTWLSAQVKG